MLLAVAGAAVLAALLTGGNPGMTAERIGGVAPTPAGDAFDRTVSTREVSLPALTWYAIQTGIFSQEDAAYQKADAYADRGAPGTVIGEGGKWRVFIASYGREEDAAAVRQRLGELQRVETYLYAWQCPELRLRLTGMAGQLDAAEAGLTLFASAGGILRDTAMLLDAGQLTAGEAMAAVEELDGQIVLWQALVQERFYGQTPELVQRMEARCEAWKGRLVALRAEAESAITLSAALKAQGMQLYDEEIRLRRALMG